MNNKQSIKTIEVTSTITDVRILPANIDGKRFKLFVKIMRGDGRNSAAGIGFDNEEDAQNAQKLIHNVINEVLA